MKSVSGSKSKNAPDAVRWTSTALNDLKKISGHIERQRNLATANRVCRIIYDAVQILRRFPESGKTGIEEGTRELVVPAMPSYIVVYRVVYSEAVQILRIWHGAQERRE
jgi:toxin ParE1/3/4